MSRVMRRKHVLKEMFEDDFELPKEQQQIVRVVSSRGNNLHEVESAQSDCTETFLVSMPNKFRKNLWVKRGDFVLIEPIEEGEKVKAEICKILTAQHVKEYTKAGIWPKKFTKKREHEDDPGDQQNNEECMDAECETFMIRNQNRPPKMSLTDESEDDSDSDDSDYSENEAAEDDG